MAFSGKRWVMFALAGGLAAGLIPSVFAAGPAPAAGDRIQFSEHELPRGLVPSGEDPLSRAGRFEVLQRGGSMGGVVESLPGPSSGSMMRAPNARLLELMEQRKNWIYVTEPGAGGFGTSAEQVMGVRSYDLSEAANSPRGGMREFMQSEREAQKPAASSANLLFDSRRDGLLFDSYRVDDLTGGGAGRYLERRPGSDLGSGSLGFGGLNSGAGPAQAGAGRGETGVESTVGDRTSLGAGSIRDLLRSTETSNPLLGGFDPIDFRIDTTRQELNPTNPQRPMDGSPNHRALDLFGNVNPGQGDSGGSGLSGVLDRLAPGTQGASSLAPVVRAPPDAGQAQPMRRFGEYPSRRF